MGILEIEEEILILERENRVEYSKERKDKIRRLIQLREELVASLRYRSHSFTNEDGYIFKREE